MRRRRLFSILRNETDAMIVVRRLSRSERPDEQARGCGRVAFRVSAQRQIVEPPHLLAVIVHDPIDLRLRQHLLPLAGAAFAEKILVGVLGPLAETSLLFLGLQS